MGGQSIVPCEPQKDLAACAVKCATVNGCKSVDCKYLSLFPPVQLHSGAGSCETKNFELIGGQGTIRAAARRLKLQHQFTPMWLLIIGWKPHCGEIAQTGLVTKWQFALGLGDLEDWGNLDPNSPLMYYYSFELLLSNLESCSCQLLSD